MKPQYIVGLLYAKLDPVPNEVGTLYFGHDYGSKKELNKMDGYRIVSVDAWKLENNLIPRYLWTRAVLEYQVDEYGDLV